MIPCKSVTPSCDMTAVINGRYITLSMKAMNVTHYWWGICVRSYHCCIWHNVCGQAWTLSYLMRRIVKFFISPRGWVSLSSQKLCSSVACKYLCCVLERKCELKICVTDIVWWYQCHVYETSKKVSIFVLSSLSYWQIRSLSCSM